VWIFCFWMGELVQMLSGDLITYWRVLPIYFWILAIAVRESGATIASINTIVEDRKSAVQSGRRSMGVRSSIFQKIGS
jgi:hypothetical protein